MTHALAGWLNRHQQAVINCLNGREPCSAATDFFTVEVWPPHGLATCDVLFIMNFVTRSVHVAGVTTTPNSAYMKQVAGKLTQVCDGFLSNNEFLIYSWDRTDAGADWCLRPCTKL